MQEIINSFKDHLIKNKASEITARNYLADLNKFGKWFEAYYLRPLELKDITAEIIELYKDSQEAQGSSRSIERYMSTLRKFTNFLAEKNLIANNPLLGTKPKTDDDPWDTKGFKNYLYVDGASKLTIRNYSVDIAAFTLWLKNRIGIQSDSSKYIEIINNDTLAEYVNELSNNLKLSPSSIKRKLSSIRKYLSFKNAGEKIGKNTVVPTLNTLHQETNEDMGISLEDLETKSVEPIIESYSPIPPVRLIQRITEPYELLEDAIATKIALAINKKKLSDKAGNHESAKGPIEIPFFKKIIHHARFTRPEWYKRYHSIAAVHYFHLAVLIIYASIIGFMMYSNLFTDAARQKATAASMIAPPKLLSFQGRLTDASDNPITNPTDVRFIIYDDPTASGSSLLWQESQNVTPDKNGVFQVLLGSVNGIGDNVLQQHDTLYLGVTINQTAELTPRPRLATVAYAANTRSLQGMVPITATTDTANVILALDSSGNLTMGGSANPTFQASGGQFTLSGQTLLLSTNAGSNGNVSIVPDGTGNVDIESSLVNNGTNGLITPGGLEIDDRASVFATESAVAAFIVSNNTTGGDLIAASSSGTTRFVLSNTGDISFQPGVSLDTLGLGTISIGNTSATNISIGRAGQPITLPGYNNQNGVLFGSFGTGALSQATTSSTGLCLISGASNPTWGACSASDSTWAQNAGLISPNNITADFAIGGQSSSSAKFAILNVNGTGPVTATLSGNLIVMPVNGNGGNVGIGEVNPTVALDIKSGADTNVLRLQDSDGTCDHNPEAGTEVVTCSSDQRLKTNIVDAQDVLPTLMNLHVKDYTVIASGDELTGVIAQEVQKTNPEMVKVGPGGFLQVELPSPWVLLKGIQEVNNKIIALGANITTNIVNTESVVTNTISSGTASLGDVTASSLSLATNNISIAGQSLNDYVQGIVQQAVSSQLSVISGQIISPLASVDEIHTNIISPIGNGSNISIGLGGSEISIHSSTASNSAVVASIDNAGNATFSGALIANGLQSSANATIAGTLTAESVVGRQLTVNGSATVSGTLYADNINAGSIEGLDSRIKNLLAGTSNISSSSSNTISNYHEQLAAASSTDSAGMIASLNDGQWSVVSGQSLDIGSISSDFGTFRNGLIALGPATFGQATVLNSLSIGTNMTISDNSINSLSDLEIQPLRQGGVSFLAGLVRINTDGTLKLMGNEEIAGNLKVGGQIQTNVISPLPGSDLALKTSSGSAVLAQGNIIASGSGTFAKLNLSLAEPAYAISDTEATATGSAGLGTIKQYRTELTIYDPNVTDKSLIYITPTGQTSNQVLSLIRQTPEDSNAPGSGSFTVGINLPTNQETKFNWIIVN